MGVIKYFAERVVNPVLRKMGGEIVPNHRAIFLPSALARIAEKNIEVHTVIDICASYGKWSEVARRFYPNAFYLLIEAQKVHEEELQVFKARHENSDYVLAAAGDCIGELYFDESDPFGGVASHTPLQGDRQKVTRVPVTTVDAEVSTRKLKPPYLLKLDTHGFEVPTNGSMAGHADPPFAETGNVHDGRQSMPVYYENNFKYSEITMTLVYPRDWTEEGVGVLSLWFCGDASNAAERMYVALNGSAVVYHENPNAALIDTWSEWTIDLQEFAALGVNLANVNTISIGFGDKNNLQAGGSGMVLFDDIRLYRPAP